MFKIHEHDFDLIMKFSNFVPLSFFYLFILWSCYFCEYWMPIIAFINSYFSFFYIKKMAWAIYVSIKDFIGVLSLTLIFDTHCGGE